MPLENRYRSINVQTDPLGSEQGGKPINLLQKESKPEEKSLQIEIDHEGITKAINKNTSGRLGGALLEKPLQELTVNLRSEEERFHLEVNFKIPPENAQLYFPHNHIYDKPTPDQDKQSLANELIGRDNHERGNRFFLKSIVVQTLQ